MKSLTPEQVVKSNSLKNQSTYLTTPELAAFLGRSVVWLLGEIKAGRVTADAMLKTGKRGRPAYLFAETKHRKASAVNAKAADARQVAKAEQAERKAARMAAKAAKQAEVVQMPKPAVTPVAEQTADEAAA